jgi:hypothetical protein
MFGREITKYTAMYGVYIYGSGQPCKLILDPSLASLALSCKLLGCVWQSLLKQCVLGRADQGLMFIDRCPAQIGLNNSARNHDI